MINISLVEFTSNVATSLNGGARLEYKKGTKVIVVKSEVLSLLRLGCKVVGEFEFDYKENKKLIDNYVEISRAEQEKKEAELELERQKYLDNLAKAEAKAKKAQKEAEEKEAKRVEEAQKEAEKDREEFLKEQEKAREVAEQSLVDAKIKAQIEKDRIQAKVDKGVKEAKK